MQSNEKVVGDGLRARDLADWIVAVFPMHGSATMFAGAKVSYNTVLKAVAIATGRLVPLGVVLGCESEVREHTTGGAVQKAYKVIATNRP
jgi:stage V sporulation protein SpoVS